MNYKKRIASILTTLLLLTSFLLAVPPIASADSPPVTLYFEELQQNNVGNMSTTQPRGTSKTVNLDDAAQAVPHGIIWQYPIQSNLHIQGTVTVDLYVKSKVAGTRNIMVSLGEITSDQQIGSTQSQRVFASALRAKKVSFSFSNLDVQLTPNDLFIVFVNTTVPEVAGQAVPRIDFNIVYGGQSTPASVTINDVVTTSLGQDQSESHTYWLHKNNVMNTTEPTAVISEKASLSNTNHTWYSSPLNKDILLNGDVVTHAYITLSQKGLIFKRDQTVDVMVSLLDVDPNNGETTIASTTKTVSSTDGTEEITFTFSVSEEEVAKNHQFALKITGGAAQNTFDLHYDSTNHPSYTEITYTEKKSPIRLDFDHGPPAMKPGGGTTHAITIYNQGETNDTVTLSSDPSLGWITSLENTTLFIPATAGNNTNSTLLHVNAPNYADNGTITLTAVGATGETTATMNVTSSPSAYVYNATVYKPKGKNARPEETITYTFSIKNTGDTQDTYALDVSSEHDWNTSISDANITLANGVTSDDITVSVEIPGNVSVGTKDILSFSITSHTTNQTEVVSVTTTIAAAGVLEILYDAFMYIAEVTGLEQVAGSMAPYVLLLILVSIIAAVVLIVVWQMRRRYVDLVCLNRSKEIVPGGSVVYTVGIANPSAQTLSYTLSADFPSGLWTVNMKDDQLVLEPGEMKEVEVDVEASDKLLVGDTAEIAVDAQVDGKPAHSERLLLMVCVKPRKADLAVTDVSHRPARFNSGDRVVTSFKVENQGDAPAEKVSIILYANGREMNRVDDVTIPEDSYASVEFPWIALYGENKIHITVR